jgi:hypothetical protein
LHYDTIYDTIIVGGVVMAGTDKIIEKMKQQPNGIRPEEVEYERSYVYESGRIC